MRGRNTRQHHGDGTAHPEHQPCDFEPRETVDAQDNREKQHQQGNDRVDDRAVDRRRLGESVHNQRLAHHPDQQRSADHLGDVAAVDPLPALPQQRNEREEGRHRERSRHHGDRIDPARQHQVVERIVHRPDDIAYDQGDMRLDRGTQTALRGHLGNGFSGQAWIRPRRDSRLGRTAAAATGFCSGKGRPTKTMPRFRPEPLFSAKP